MTRMKTILLNLRFNNLLGSSPRTLAQVFPWRMPHYGLMFWILDFYPDSADSTHCMAIKFPLHEFLPYHDGRVGVFQRSVLLGTVYLCQGHPMQTFTGYTKWWAGKGTKTSYKDTTAPLWSWDFAHGISQARPEWTTHWDHPPVDPPPAENVVKVEWNVD